MCVNIYNDGGFHLMINNDVVKSIILPWPSHTDIRVRANWTYDIDAPPYVGPPPRVALANLAEENDDDYDMEDHVSPTHTTPYFSDHFASTTSGHASESGLQDGKIPQDKHYATLYRRQQEMMVFMRELHAETHISYHNIW